jgi:hypothetical protein
VHTANAVQKAAKRMTLSNARLRTGKNGGYTGRSKEDAPPVRMVNVRLVQVRVPCYVVISLN